MLLRCINTNWVEYCVGLEGGDIDGVRDTVVMDNGGSRSIFFLMVGVSRGDGS